MDEELKKLLEKNLQTSQESLRILQKMWRGVVWGRIFQAIKWAIIVVLVVVGFMTIQPYVSYWSRVVSNTSQNIQKFNSFFPK